jgi:hypothetical protein
MTAPKLPRVSRLADRAVAILVTVTLVLFAAMVALVIFLVISVSAVQGGQHSDTIVACQEANANRAEDVQIFGVILALPAIAKPQFITADMRAAQEVALAKVNAEIKTAYALRDCPALYG